VSCGGGGRGGCFSGMDNYKSITRERELKSVRKNMKVSERV
jgi:hypothetical protein